MGRNNFIKTGSIISVFLILLAIGFIPTNADAVTKKSTNVNTTNKVNNNKSYSFKNPDFAFPETVDANAEKELDKALSEGNDVKALRAAMQMVIARNLISKDNYKEGLELFDNLSRKLKPPYSQLSLLIKAKIYTSIYQSEPWIFNNRTLPLNPVPESVTEWSRDIFSQQISHIISDIFSTTDAARNTPISAISSIIENGNEAEKLKMSVYDFMTLKACDILGNFGDNSDEIIIPFGDVAKGNKKYEQSASEILNTIINDNIAWHESQNDMQLAAVMSYYKFDTMPWRLRNAYLDDCIRKFIDTPYCGAFILAMPDYPEEVVDSEKEVADSAEEELVKQNAALKKRYHQIADYLARFPGCDNEKALKNRLTVFDAKIISASVLGRLYPGEAGKINVNASNIFDFNILAVKLPDSYINSNINLNAVAQVGKVAQVLPIHFKGERPVMFDENFDLAALPAGVYVLVPSNTTTLSGIITGTAPKLSMSTFTVSSLASLTVKGEKADENRLYVVDGRNQSPVEGAKVSFTEQYNNTKSAKSITRTTNKDGFVNIPVGSYNIKISHNGNLLTGNVWNNSYSESKETKEVLGKVLTDLSVYHPGDSVGFLGILYTREGKELRQLPESKVKATLLDANRQSVDTAVFVSDRFGRFSGKFAIPETGLLGSYAIKISNSGNANITSGNFQVADYKSPTFYVVTEGTEGSYQIGDTIRIKGMAMTYSGMPVSGGKVKYNIHYMPLRWLSADVNATYGGETATEADGSFVITLPTEGLRNTQFAFGGYKLNVTVANQAGETQEASGVFFSLGEAYSINAVIPEKICADDGVQALNVTVSDIVGKPVKKTVYYKIFKFNDNSAVVKEGNFESPKFEFDPLQLSSGRYEIKFSLDKNFKSKNEETAESVTIIYRNNDKQPPYETSLWIPQDNIVADKNAMMVKVKVGSAYKDSWILVQTADCKKVISREWMKINDAVTEIEVPAPADNDCITVTLSGMHDFTQNIQIVTIIPFAQTEKVKITAESFRDRITPGAREQWKFRFTMTDNTLAGLPVSAVMSNKALNAIVPFAWNFNPSGSIYYNTVGNIQSMYFNNGGRWSLPLTKVIYGGMDRITYPNWNLYGLSLYGGSGRMSNLRVRGSAVKEEVMPTALMMKRSSNEMTDIEEETIAEDGVYMASALTSATGGVLYESAAVADNGASSDSGGGLKKDEPLREIDVPLAFFMPQMITDANGDVSVDFAVPQFNGTWQFQIMGYTEDMRGAVSVMDAIAAKPVMVQMNAPRFVRTGDKVSVAAMLYNNSVEPLNICGKIEIIDPVTNEIITSYNSAPISVEPAGSSKVSTDFLVPDNLNGLMIRVYAISEDFTDGEQTVIPVYPSSTPVLESKTFYITPGQEEFEMKVPSFEKNSKVSLQYCDNPIWEVVTALPDISEPKSSNILSLVYSLYGNAIGAGLAKDYPEIKEAIKIFSDPVNSADSTLISNLEKNQDLKNVLLNNTPWVRSAQSETLRMQSLTKYADAKRSEEIIASTLKEMTKLQNADGGWSWCAGMESSEFITARVLLHLAMLKDMGYLPADALSMAKKAVKFADESWVKSEKEYKGSTYPYVSMLNYLYVRSNFKDVQQSMAFAAMAKKGLTAVKNGWKKMDIYNKGVASILMNRSGYSMEARTILESLRQYASVSPEKGMWFDNLSSTFGTWNKLITTAQVLEAYSEIEPSSGNIDKLRQWLLIQKQAEDWGDDRDMAEVIYAILNSGTKWTVPSASAEIMIDGKRIEIDRVAQLTGNLTVNVTSKKNGNLEIHRSASGPAWGGLISQYVAPICDVKSDGTAQLSITKNLYVITDDASGSVATAGNLKVGDKVRVTLTLTTDRDLEYVAVMDARSACLEPAEQVSGYTSSDGVWMYKEVRDNSTNLFIPFLSKGTHIISYDCYVDRAGDYSLGIASAQSQYAPSIAAHSAGTLLTVTD